MTAAREEFYINTCPVGCRGDLVATEVVLAEGPLRRCTACGQLISSCTGDRYHDSMREFDAPAGTWPSGSSARRLEKQADRFTAEIAAMLGRPRQGMTLLDVGCSSGSFVNAARLCGVAASGVEPSAGPAQAAVARGLPVRRGFLEDLALEGESFDALSLFEVVEHLAWPLPLLQECHRILKPGGIMIIRTGNTRSWTAAFMGARWSYYHLDLHGGHVSFFNPASMRLLAQRSGFVVQRLRTHSVGLFEKADLPALPYRIAKIASELLNVPSRILGRGHEMVVYLRKPQQNGEPRG